MQLDPASFLKHDITEHEETLHRLWDAVGADFVHLANVCLTALQNDRKILFFGNGGSAADAQHLAAELVVRYRQNRRALPAISLSTDTSTLTAIGNDLGYDSLFSRQIEALGAPGDVAVAISTSGQSPNIILALEVARDKGMIVAGFSGRDGGKMGGLADPLLIVPSDITARIQEMHILLGHALCEFLEKSFLPEKEVV